MAKRVEIMVKVIQETEAAILVTDEEVDSKGDLIKHWLPKSQINWGDFKLSKLPSIVEIEVNEWLAKERGLI